MSKPNKGKIEVLELRLFELPSTVRCSLSNCPSLRHGDGAILVELMFFRGLLRLRKTCRQCGALYEMEAHSPIDQETNARAEDLLTRTEVRARLRVSDSTLARYSRDGLLPKIKPRKARAGRVFYRRSDVEALLTSARQPSPAPQGEH